MDTLKITSVNSSSSTQNNIVTISLWTRSLGLCLSRQILIDGSSMLFRIKATLACKTRLDTTTKFMVVVTSLSLFNLVISSSHGQSVPTCMNKPVNNHVQAGQLNHVQVCPQPCPSLSTMFKLARSTMFKLVNSTMFKPVNRQKQAVRFYVCICGRSKLKGGGCKLYVSSL